MINFPFKLVIDLIELLLIRLIRFNYHEFI